MNRTEFFPLAASHLNLRRLLLIRLIVFCCQLLALVYAWLMLELSLAYPMIIGTLTVIALFNIGLLFRLGQAWPVSDQEFLLHLLMDVLFLSVLLYYSGGANNPFVSYYLVPITIAAAILPWKYTWVVTGVCLFAYSVLLVFYRPFPELQPMDMAMESNFPSLHILGMWVNFLVSAALITYFVVKMAAEIREKEARLTLYRENNLRNEQILAVATQAAGTAHELGTPLNTMAVLIKEMQASHTANQQLAEDLSLLDQQLQRCKSSLKELVSQADIKGSGNVVSLQLDQFIRNILEQWQLLRPEVRINFQIPEHKTSPLISSDRTLQQAIVNILNNAADSSPEGVDVSIDWDRSTWTLAIRDYGKGLNEELAQQLGTAFISTKESGLGVGLVLSHASINRLGGTISIQPGGEKGTLTIITLPLTFEDLS